MVFKQTKLSINNSGGLLLMKTIHTFTYKLNSAKIGNFSKGTILKVLKKKKKFLGSKIRFIILQTKFTSSLIDASYVNFKINSGCILKIRMNIIKGYVRGPVMYTIKRKKFLTSFNIIIICLII